MLLTVDFNTMQDSMVTTKNGRYTNDSKTEHKMFVPTISLIIYMYLFASVFDTHIFSCSQ